MAAPADPPVEEPRFDDDSQTVEAPISAATAYDGAVWASLEQNVAQTISQMRDTIGALARQSDPGPTMTAPSSPEQGLA